MNKKKLTLRDNLQLIADILSFNSNILDLEFKLKNSEIDWDIIVRITSKHLILTTLYCRLYQKNLIPHLPKDLLAYLEHVTELNRERNITLRKEIDFISILFDKNNIEHVFIKGASMLAGNYYNDIGERMVGDIDILVATKDLETSFQLLIEQGYSDFVEFNYEVKNFRHLPRQISKDRVGAVEIHNQLFKHGFNHLINKDLIIESKVKVNGINIPNEEFAIENIILAHQINDKNSYLGMIGFKGIYDVLLMKLDSRHELIDKLSNEEHSLKFLTLSSIFFPSIAPNNYSFKTKVYKNRFMLNLKYKKLRLLDYKMKHLLLNISERLNLIFSNKSYRRRILYSKGVK